MKVTNERIRGGGGWLKVEVDGETYYTLDLQKPLHYGGDLVVFAPGPKPGKTIGRKVVKRGSLRQTIDEDLPASDFVYDLASDDPVLVAVTRAWMDGTLPLGEINLERFGG